MSLTNDEVFELAANAVRAMHTLHGSDYTFPSDLIWQNIPGGVNIPSTARPHQPKRLIRAGLLELTGGMTKAKSEQRAGSMTKEYRFGPALTGTQAAAAPTVQATAVSSPVAATASESLRQIQASMEADGYLVSSAELANFLLAMTVSPLVILSGISGTGKSLLPRKFAKLTDSIFRAIPVQPQWSDNSDLLGYVPTLSPDKYVKGALVETLLDAKNHSDKLVIALLDEMNLAPVEHYFSDFLSVVETRSRNGAHISTDPLPIELPRVIEGTADVHTELRGIQLPSNLRVVGTANMDETTHVFSPKVLDRAFTIEFDDPDLTTFSTLSNATTGPAFPDLAKFVFSESNALSVHEARAESEALFEHIAGLLGEIQEILSPAGIKFGYRTRDAILMYLHFWKKLNLKDIITGYAALDFCILQKILPKVSGSGEALAESLKALSAWLAARSTELPSSEATASEFSGPMARSQQKVERMIALLDLDGATRYWGA